VFILPPAALGGGTDLVGGWGRGGPGELGALPRRGLGQSPSSWGSGGKTPGKIFENLNAHSCVLVHFKAIN
jgi:hypothetical protein